MKKSTHFFLLFQTQQKKHFSFRWLSYCKNAIFLFFLLVSTVSFANGPSETIAWKSPMMDDGRRYLALMFTNDSEDDQYLDVIENAHSKGFNAIYLSVRMDAIKCHHEECMIGSVPNPNWNPANRSWTQVDAQVNKARQLGMKIALRVHFGSADFLVTRSTYLWGADRLAKDENGNTIFGGWNFTKFTLSSQPAIDSAKAFLQEVLNRYGYLEGEGNLLFISFSNTSSQELEYDHTFLLDYSDASKNEYASWYMTNYGTSNPNYPTEFTSTEGKKWYRFRHCKLKDFVRQLSGVVRAHNSNIKTVQDVGSAFDGGSARRGTLGFKSLAEEVDGFKVNDDFSYDHRFSIDILRGSLPGKWVMNEAFLTNDYSPGYYYNFGNDVFAHGGKMLAVVTVNNGYLNKHASDWSDLSTQWIAGSNGNMSPVSTTGTVNYTFNEILNASFSGNQFSSGARNIYQEWLNQYNGNPSNAKPVNVVLDDSELQCTSCTPPAAPTLSASPDTITSGNSSNLSASGCAGTVTWSHGLGTGNSKSVSPTSTTTYTATCTVDDCTSSNGSVTVTVQSSGNNPCGLTEKQVLGTWNDLNVESRLFTVNGNPTWLIVTAYGSSPVDQHFPRGANFATQGSINWSGSPYSQSCFGGGETGWGGLEIPSGIATPSGYVRDTMPDGAIYFALSPCTPPAAPSLNASPSTITSGNSSDLTASGCAGTVTWSHGLGTGTSKTVSPTTTTTYTATCTVDDCTSSNGSVTVTVNEGTVNCGTSGGFFDEGNCNYLAGWAWDGSQPNTPVTVEVYEGATLIQGNILADQFRQDLLDADIGNGVHGFSIPLPSALRDGGSHWIVIKMAGCTFELNNSPKHINGCTGSSAVLSPVDNENEAVNKGLSVYPNPSNGVFQSSFYLEKGKKATLSVVDMQGRIIHHQQVIGQGLHRERINLPNKASGMLILKLVTDKTIEVKKFDVVR